MGSSRVGVAHVKTMLNLYRHCPTSSAATAATISMPLDLNIILYYIILVPTLPHTQACFGYF